MNRPAVRYFALLAILCLSTSSTRADDKQDNPKYALWSKFQPGSNSTVSADLNLMGKKIHLDVTKTLVSVTKDELIVSTLVKATVNGREQSQPAKNETIPAKTDKLELKLTGEKDVDAMGKTFKCKVWDAKANPNPANPDSMTNMTATICTSDQIPGGLVKLEGMGKTNTPLTFVLTAMESK